MAVNLGKKLITSFFRPVQGQGVAPVATRGVSSQAYKTAGYASIPYEKPPTVADTVPTKYSDGTAFWSDYCTPTKIWTA